MANFANCNICNQMQNLQVNSPTYHRTGDSAGENSKSGVTLGLDHIYLLKLFDLYVLHYGSLFGFESSTRIWDTL